MFVTLRFSSKEAMAACSASVCVADLFAIAGYIRPIPSVLMTRVKEVLACQNAYLALHDRLGLDGKPENRVRPSDGS